VDDVIHSTFFLAQVFSVSVSEFIIWRITCWYMLAELLSPNRYLGGAVFFPRQVESDSDEECAMS
jgi:hypothetical protein